MYTIEEVVVRPDIRKDQSTNEMAVVSTRSFTIDETERYAGSLGDPSRMAANCAGGHRKLPINEAQSLADNTLRFKWSESYSERFPNYFRLNGRVTFRMNRNSVDHEWGLDLQNMTNRENVFIQNWDNNKKEVTTHYQMGFMPMMTYRIYF